MNPLSARVFFYATNPDPKNGGFLHPKDTRRHAVKVFIPGVIRSDYAYLDRVIASMRNWRDYGPSLQRLYAMEDEHLAQKGPEHVENARRRRSPLPAHVEWFMENYDLIRDFSARRFPMRLHTYEKLLAEPERILGGLFEWLGAGDLAGGLAAIDEKVRTQKIGPIPEGMPGHHVEIFDELWQTLHDEKPLAGSLVRQMNDVHHELQAMYGSLSRERGRDDTALSNSSSTAEAEAAAKAGRT